ncbi:MAG: pantoate--beta-alanine ligase [Gammaproteobacteria bacterium]|nr:MAG: pantoate--beta-alanine ligase [Gammaproteobacteria bacterium]
MQIAETITALRTQIKVWRQQNQTIAFVPTMGNLHQGHLSLVAKAQELADKVVVSVFVNPLQFNDATDLAAYPRTLEQDIQQLVSVDCDLLFTPTSEMMYPNGMEAQTTVSVPGMDDKLCGRDRPGHFDGVVTIVNKLFNMVQADIAIFGEKDYQQLLLIKIMVQDLNLPIEIVGSPTYRESSGLAMSSRNQYLTDPQREQAAELYQTLLTVKAQLEQGDQSFDAIQQQAIEHLNNSGFATDYVDIRRADNLEQAKAGEKSLRILLAAKLGQARLIDNIACNLA